VAGKEFSEINLLRQATAQGHLTIQDRAKNMVQTGPAVCNGAEMDDEFSFKATDRGKTGFRPAPE